MTDNDERTSIYVSRGGRPMSAQSVVQHLLKEMNLEAALLRHSLSDKWPEIVDATIAQHTRVERVSGSTLYLEVDSSVWMNELSALKGVLLQKINAFLRPAETAIMDIRFHQRSWARRPGLPAAPPKEPAFQPSEEDMRQIRLALQSIKDDDLRRTFERIMLNDLALKKRRSTQK